MAYLFLGCFLVIEGINRIGLTFNGQEVVKGILLVLGGILLAIGR
jgi:uncharacterized membrane protein HdeD (DUF308 family)